MGGDEFLVFTKGLTQDDIKNAINVFIENLKKEGYNVAIGTSYRSQNVNCEEMVREAEVRMYGAKAQYYQNKENVSISRDNEEGYVQAKTGIVEIDTMLSILKDHYNGIYRVSLEEDAARRILMPAYLGYNENENNFSSLVTKYIDELVHPDFHRAMISFLDYDALKKQILEGHTPRITYKKINGEIVVLSVYKLGEGKNGKISDTLWVFAKN